MRLGRSDTRMTHMRLNMRLGPTEGHGDVHLQLRYFHMFHAVPLSAVTLTAPGPRRLCSRYEPLL